MHGFLQLPFIATVMLTVIKIIYLKIMNSVRFLICKIVMYAKINWKLGMEKKEKKVHVRKFYIRMLPYIM